MLTTTTYALGATNSQKIAAMSAIVSLLLEEDPSPSVIAYAFADQAGLPSYTISNKFNYAGGTVTGTRLSKGNYVLEFTGLNFSKPRISFQVSAIGNSGTCVLEESYLSAVSVACFDKTGASVDSKYTLSAMQVGVTTGANVILYGLTHRPELTNSYLLLEHLSFNAAGGRPTATRLSAGRYIISTVNNDFSDSVVHVNGLAGSNCNAQFWVTEYVEVRCFDDNGSPVDGPFNIVIIKDDPQAVANTMLFVTVTPPKATEYLASPGEYYSVDNKAPIINRSTIGRYTVSFPGLDLFALGQFGVPIITTASQNRVCRNTGWQRDEVFVECTSASGSHADSNFVIHYYR
jgi:hypothetical protein